MPFFIQLGIIPALFLATRPRRNDRDRWLPFNQFDEGIGIIAFVANHVVALASAHQSWTLGDIVGLSARQDKIQGIA